MFLHFDPLSSTPFGCHELGSDAMLRAAQTLFAEAISGLSVSS